jgi:hypothetical protein
LRVVEDLNRDCGTGLKFTALGSLPFSEHIFPQRIPVHVRYRYIKTGILDGCERRGLAGWRENYLSISLIVAKLLANGSDVLRG